MNDFNIILDTDSYKSGHYLQYPPKTTKLIAYLESRGGLYDKTVFFGLQYILKRYLSTKITAEHVKEAQEFFAHHKLPFNYEGWNYIVKKHKGNIPLAIFAVPEGSVIPVKNILMRVESTDPNCAWLTTWFETMLLRVWYPITVSTNSWYLKRLIYRYLEISADKPDEEVMFKIHDFGARGVSSAESAGIGGAAHLVNFSGSDTIQGMFYSQKYYHAELTPSSIPAAEHSTIMVWGKEHEEQAFKNIFSQLAKISPLIALPADTYDHDFAVSELWGKRLQELVIHSGITLVVRTDSGVPDIVVLQTLKTLEHAYGAVTNNKGYKVLNGVRVLHSDSISYDTIQKIYKKICDENKYSASNIVFGMGGELLQKINRDTQQFAYKVSVAEVNGEVRPVAKSPASAEGKKSRSGYLDLIKSENGYKTIQRKETDKRESVLQLVFKNGNLLIDLDFNTIRDTAWK